MKNILIWGSILQYRNTDISDYHKAKSHNNLSGNDPTNFPFFEAMDEVLGDRPLAQSGEYGVDFTFDEEEEEEEEEEDVGGAEENLDVLGVSVNIAI